jgi:hypothetical protein
MQHNPLTAEETRVVELLWDDWRDVLRCTSIDQAMERAGTTFSHAQRLRIAKFLLRDPQADPLMRWQPTTYVLTNQEKLIARRILRLRREGAAVPQPDKASRDIFGLDDENVLQAFETLRWLGFLQKTDDAYQLAQDYARFLQGLGFYFHEVSLSARKERFNTNCAPDFFIMTNSSMRQRLLERVAAGPDRPITVDEGMTEKMVVALRGGASSTARPLSQSAFYGNERAILNDACGWSDEPITVVMDHGRLAEVTPDSTRYLLGGGCGMNNLFSSEAALRAWLSDHPQFNGRQAGPLAEVLAQM